MKSKLLVALSIATALCGCDDETVGIGQFVADADRIPSHAASYPVTTRSLLLDSVYSRSSTAYLGKFTDEDYGTFNSDFLVQINCPENFRLPENIDEEQGITEAKLGLYYTNFFGDPLATLRVQVDTLSKVIEDDGTDKNLYYSNLDPLKKGYYDPAASFKVFKDYSARDMTVSDSLYDTDNYYPNVSIDLGKDFCNYFLEKYDPKSKEHPNFRDAESFINNVLKGFYVHTTNGEGSVLYISDIYLHLTVAYHSKTEAGKDTIVHTTVPMSATKEVFMSTRFQNSGLEGLEKEKGHTYLKTPAGLCTEVTLPLAQMYDELKGDTLNSISVSFTKLKETEERPFKMGTPSTLLMVRKNEMTTFFEENKIFDDKTSFGSTYNSSTNSYKFSKLNRLISHIFSEIRAAEAEHGSDWQKHMKKGWDQVLLVPITTESDSQGNVIGVENDLDVNSARLAEGTEAGGEIKLEVLYTNPVQH